jgi:S-(hydroxymethyl)glutathione dehydrogenase/alcohol dehydrogenase
MKASVFRDGAANLNVEEVDIAPVGHNEIRVRTAAAGICHSDLYHLRGVFDVPMPTILGHESAGVVQEVGRGVTDFVVGDHVITCLTPFCGRCQLCLSGRSYLCSGVHSLRRPEEGPRLFQGDNTVHQFLNISSFAEEVLVHESAAVRIRSEMPLDLAALIGCGVTTGMGAVLNKADVRPGQTVAVIGCGGVGLSALQGARIAGASRVIAVDPSADKLNVAISMGATDVIVVNRDGGVDDTALQIRELTKGGVDHAIEAVGSAATASAAVECLAVGGVATIVGLMPSGITFPVQGRLLLDDRRVQGAYMGARNFRVSMPMFVDMYLDGRLLLEEMVSSRIGLGDIDDAFRSMERGDALRDLVVFK